MNFIDCLEIVSKDELTRSMVVIEDCGEVDELYDELCVAYDPEKSKADMISIINESNNELADKMLALLDANPGQLFIMMRAEGKTFTEYFVEQCGGSDGFLMAYDPDRINLNIPNLDEETAEQVGTEKSVAGQAGVESTEFSNSRSPEEYAGNVQTVPTSVSVAPEDVGKMTAAFENMQSAIVSASKKLDEAYERLCNKEESISARFGCMKEVLNPDGTFRGFTKKNITEMTESIRELDKDINLGTLDPSEVLDADGIKKAVGYVEDFDPNIFKQFLLTEMSKAETADERVFVSGVLDRFFSYVEANV